MGIIEAAKLAFEYKKYDENGEVEEMVRAIDGVDLDVKKGDFVAILGHNGSGKSTLAKQINAILAPTEGTLYVDGKDVRDEQNIWDVRQAAGMVFQNPDNQIIGTVVEEDVGFGPENMGIPTEEIWERVEESLKSVGMWKYRKNSPNKLSGGQKQRVAIAGVVAMHPKCIVLDEPTAMLDPTGRREVIRTIRALAEIVAALAVPPVRTAFGQPDASYRENANRQASIRSTERLESLGWHPSVSPEEGFARTVNSFLS